MAVATTKSAATETETATTTDKSKSKSKETAKPNSKKNTKSNAKKGSKSSSSEPTKGTTNSVKAPDLKTWGAKKSTIKEKAQQPNLTDITGIDERDIDESSPVYGGSLIGSIVRLYCSVDKSYHVGRILDWRVSLKVRILAFWGWGKGRVDYLKF